MLDKKRIMSLTFLSYGGEMSGDHYGMRYMLKKIEKTIENESDNEEKQTLTVKKILAIVWPEPLCIEKTPDEKKTTCEFEFTEDGRNDAIDWLQSMYDSKREVWDHAPRLL